MGKGLEKIFLQTRHTDGQQSYRKMLHITKYYGNADQNHKETPLQQDGHYFKQQLRTSAGDNVENRNSGKCRDVQWGQLLWKTVQLLKNKKQKHRYDSAAIPLLGVSPKEMKAGFQKVSVRHDHSSIIHNNPKVGATQVLTNRW